VGAEDVPRAREETVNYLPRDAAAFRGGTVEGGKTLDGAKEMQIEDLLRQLDAAGKKQVLRAILDVIDNGDAYEVLDEVLSDASVKRLAEKRGLI
jgi:hypothetical protein